MADSGREHLLVPRAVRTTGHCEFSAVEAGTAWDDLVAWVEDGARPDGDDVLDAETVADPAYGCRFSDAGFLARERDRLFPDELFADLFEASGRRSVPPSVVATGARCPLARTSRP